MCGGGVGVCGVRGGGALAVIPRNASQDRQCTYQGKCNAPELNS